MEREFFIGGKYFFATVIATDRREETGKLLAIETRGRAFVAKPSMGHMKKTDEDPNEFNWVFPNT